MRGGPFHPNFLPDVGPQGGGICTLGKLELVTGTALIGNGEVIAGAAEAALHAILARRGLSLAVIRSTLRVGVLGPG